MLVKIKDMLLGDVAYKDTKADSEERQQLALASLLVEMARADFDESQEEHSRIIDLLSEHFDLSSAQALELLNRAREANDKAVCLFDFTRALHQSLDANQKLEVIRLLWEVALTDTKLDKYEDFLVRKVADLLYVSHSDVIRIKHEVSGL
ncbi:MAG: hypothetical protein CL799_12295 [Chromatiales bacterium]|jgi:uncharacterized tellurite resistance protein B-like protein|nr:hypothetical protein [Chromatiales bacterium]MDP6151295.1 TerB family tellurite resistance protein [Gammaproteobacteria bacterium]MDP7270458.1 TerB family tellurite resistance protein [Gammaproteobacteria bacterium]HJP05275.1 TerB family tellurite resistance protein [Gammaproteobacteria bacterium]